MLENQKLDEISCCAIGRRRKTLTNYNTIFTLNDPEKETFRKHCGKPRKCWLPAFPPFPTMFSTLSLTEIIILATYNLSSASAFNLVLSKNLLLDKVFNPKNEFLRTVWEKDKILVTSTMFSVL